jgi:hypothetical protein
MSAAPAVGTAKWMHGQPSKGHQQVVAYNHANLMAEACKMLGQGQ